MTNVPASPMAAQNTLAVAVSVELATRVFEKISGGIVANNIQGVPLNKQAVSSLISSKLNAELLAKAGSV